MLHACEWWLTWKISIAKCSRLKFFMGRGTWKKYLLIAAWLNLLNSRLHSAWSLRSRSGRKKCLKIKPGGGKTAHDAFAPRLIITQSRVFLSLFCLCSGNEKATTWCKFLMKIYVFYLWNRKGWKRLRRWLISLRMPVETSQDRWWKTEARKYFAMNW